MKLQFLSILPASPSANPSESSDGNPTVTAPADSGGDVASYTARYQAFLDQQSQKTYRTPYGLSALGNVVRGLVNLAIFVALFLAILTLLGFGLSRLGGNANVAKGDVSVTNNQTASSADKTSQSPMPSKKKANTK